MTITIISLYSGHSADHFVGAVLGSLTDEQKQAIVSKHLQNIGRGEVGEDVDEIGFAEVEVGPEIPRELAVWTQDGFESGDMSGDVEAFGPEDIAGNMD